MKFLRSLLSVALAFLIVILGLVVWANYSAYREEQQALATPSPTLPPYDAELFTTPPVSEPTEAPVVAPENAVSFTIAFAGDVVCHTGLNSEAETDSGYDYSPILNASSDYLSSADFAVCTSLETTFPSTSEYTGYPKYKSPKELAAGLASAGLDLISTSSEHCMDSDLSGLAETLDTLDANALDHVGTYRSVDERNETGGVVVENINGVNVAFLSYTFGVNDVDLSDSDYAVNILFSDYLTSLDDIDYPRIEGDMAIAKALGTDLIVVLMHWGYEYYTEPVPYQEEIADTLFSLGADIIVGGHSHVPGPMEIRKVVDSNGEEKTGFLCYSLGNYISCQDDKYTTLTAILNLEIEKDLDTGNTYLKNVSYAPLFMVDLNDYDVFDAGWRYRLWDLNGAISAYEGGDDMGVINTGLYDALKQGLNDLHTLLGSQYDMFSADYVPNLVGEMPAPEAD